MISVYGAYAKTFVVTESKIVECDEKNQTDCKVTGSAINSTEIELPEPKKSFSVENPSTNTA